MKVTKLDECRFCGGSNFSSVYSLGDLYPSNFVKTQYGLEKAPLELVQCRSCGLVQLGHTIELDSMYKVQYWYRSSLNASMLRDLADVVREIEATIELKSQDLVIDIGCNDGSLFEFYKEKNLTKIGFDPAPNLAESAKQKCTHFFNEYFPFTNTLKDAKVITSIAMFYDLPKITTFVEAIKSTLAPDGIWVIQLTDLLSMFTALAFDNICHEHLEYYSLFMIRKIVEYSGLRVFKVSTNKVNGGSIRVFVDKGIRPVEESVEKRLTEEDEYFRVYNFDDFKEDVDRIKTELFRFLSMERARGKSIFALGASTKGNTLLQYFNITELLVPFAAEVNKDKFGLSTVGTNIEIISEEKALALNPDYFLILPWHFTESILQKDWAKKYMEMGGAFIQPLPEFTIHKKDVKEKSISELIDSLITADIKCFMAQEKLMDNTIDSQQRLDSAVLAQKMNARRNMLMRAIDEKLDKNFVSVTEKTYG